MTVSDDTPSPLDILEAVRDDVREFVTEAKVRVLISRLAAFREDNTRLRALIADARGLGLGDCPWCDRGNGDWNHAPSKDYPDRTCPAFTPDGEVR